MKSAVLLLALVGASAFSSSPRTTRPSLQLRAQKGLQHGITAAIVASTLAFAPLIATPPAGAYESSDYASETVTAVVDSLKNAGSSSSETFKAFEDIAAIITEGKGVGGSINYSELFYCINVLVVLSLLVFN